MMKQDTPCDFLQLQGVKVQPMSTGKPIMTAYYNEIDPKAAAWLRELIAVGAIAPGYVDERSVIDVPSNELAAYTQVHLFAGIGVWSYALRQAGWPDDRPVWTGSCPCQPYSSAGQRKGADDDRDLWWAMFWHIQQCRPETIFGEQVSSKSGLAWWDVVAANLEGADYACTALDLCAAGVGAPHIRQRLFWVGHSPSDRLQGLWGCAEGKAQGDTAQRTMPANGMADAKCSQWGEIPQTWKHRQHWKISKREETSRFTNGCPNSRLAHPTSRRLNGQQAIAGKAGGRQLEDSGVNSCWADAIWLPCADGKARPIKPGLSPLVDGVAPDLVRGCDRIIQTEQTAEAKTTRLSGYGNSIVAPLAVKFISAFLEL